MQLVAFISKKKLLKVLYYVFIQHSQQKVHSNDYIMYVTIISWKNKWTYLNINIVSPDPGVLEEFFDISQYEFPPND